MAKSVLELAVGTGQWDSGLKKAQRALNNFVDASGGLKDALDRDSKSLTEFVKMMGNMDSSAKTARGQVKEYTASLEQLSRMYNSLSDSEKKGEIGKAFTESMASLTNKAKAAKSEMDSINSSLGDTSSASGGAGSALDALTSKFGLSTKQLVGWGAAIGAAKAALDVAKDAFFQSESNIDEWGRTVEGAKGAYNTFLDTLNNGNWQNFFDNLSKAIQGGRDLYDVFDRLGSIKSNNAAAIALVQKEIAELRLAKQQGENVDAKLKAATERLAALQKQSVSAGMDAGNKSAFETIRSGVNSVGGAGVNDATIKYAVDRIMKYGQSEFDRYKVNRDRLQEMGTATRVIKGVGYDSQGNPNPDRTETYFDINKLTKEQQKQYALAQAITEGETRIQKGIAAYAQAVQEGSSSAREQFKGNRYAIQGNGGGGGGKGNKLTEDGIQLGKGMVGLTEVTIQTYESMAQLKQKLAEYQRALDNATNVVDEMAARQGISQTQWKMSDEGRLAAKIGWNKEDLEQARKEMSEAIGPIKVGVEIQPIDTSNIKEMADDGDKASKSMLTAAQAANALGSAVSQIEDPTAKIVALVAQGIAGVMAGAGQAISAKDTTQSGYAWIGAAATIIAEAATIASQIHSISGYAEGGIIPGNNYSGDLQLARVNAGELILSRSQQANLARSLEGTENRGGASNSTPYVTGENIYLGINNYLKRTGRGELVTSK